jgi:hypothetical protein
MGSLSREVREVLASLMLAIVFAAVVGGEYVRDEALAEGSGRICAGDDTHRVGSGVETAVRSISFGVGW